MLWRVQGKAVEPIENTRFVEQQLQECDLENWIESNPDILGEPLLIIGRQVNVPGVNDRLDLLALDPSGNTVIIEIKRGDLNDPVDIQALRYASYISRWPRRRIEELAEAYFSNDRANRNGTTFEAAFAELAADIDTDGIASLNGQQRILIVGQKIRSRVGSVALWLRERGIDIKIIEITPFKNPAGEGLILSPQLIIPPPSVEEFEVGRADTAADPWIKDGRTWHLERRCRKAGRELVLKFMERLKKELPDTIGPNWGQKHYVSYKVGNSIWMHVITQANQFRLHIPLPAKKWQTEQLATRLKIEAADAEDSMSEKLAGPTAVRVQRKSGSDAMHFFIKDESLLNRDAFWGVLRETQDDFRTGW